VEDAAHLEQEGQNQQLTEAPLAAKNNSKLVGREKYGSEEAILAAFLSGTSLLQQT
jgi:hypothetical protein